MQEFIKPRGFTPGDSVHIVSPSAGIMPFIPERVERAKKHLEAIGYRVIIGKSAANNMGHVSASVQDRVDDIHAAFRDKTCSLILCSIGGNHSNQLLELLDYDLIKNNPKAFCGYSDITVLHLAMLAKTGLQTFYGPTFLNQFGEYPEVLDFTLHNFKKSIMQIKEVTTDTINTGHTDEILDWFTGADSERARNLTPNNGISVWKKGIASGNALPFTIPSINHVLNTVYMPEITSPILLIDIPEGNSMHEGLSVGEFDAWFSDVLNSGLVAKSKGIAIGRAYKYTPEMVEELQKIILERCANYDIPIVYGADFGHTDPMLSIQYASPISINTESATILKVV